MINFDKQVGPHHRYPQRPRTHHTDGESVAPKLRNFSHAARQLGSSVGILSSAYHLRERITQILYLFRENAAHLFPRKVHHQGTSTQVDSQLLMPKRKSKPPPNVRTPAITTDLDMENIPEQMSRFAEDIANFLNCLNEFPEFGDEVVNASISVFHGDLKVGLWTHPSTFVPTTGPGIAHNLARLVLGLVSSSIFWYVSCQVGLTWSMLIPLQVPSRTLLFNDIFTIYLLTSANT